MKIWIGIDPGASGGLAAIYENDNTTWAFPCPPTVKDMEVLLYNSHCNWPDSKPCAVIEKVHSMPGQGVASTFKFGKNYGAWLGLLAASEIPYVEVSPQKWMKYFGAMPKDRTARKNHIKHLAQQRFPEVQGSITLKTADALLLAVYAREVAWR